eukprot:SAG31_NODE_30514_length_380_cov_0.722420_1_plen_82_part_01
MQSGRAQKELAAAAAAAQPGALEYQAHGGGASAESHVAAPGCSEFTMSREDRFAAALQCRKEVRYLNKSQYISRYLKISQNI